MSAEKNDVFSVGNFNIVNYKIPRTDKLEEQIARFEALDRKGVEKESYTQAYNVYLKVKDYDASLLNKGQIFEMTKELKLAVDAIKPNFLVKDKEISLLGFEAWDDSDLQKISNQGGDTAQWVLDGDDVLLEVTVGDIYDHLLYSCFSSAVVENGEILAVKDPIRVTSGQSSLRNSDGIGFRIALPEEYVEEFYGELRIGLGSSKYNKYFEAVVPKGCYPDSNGYVSASWTSFEDIYGNSNIISYVDSLDYIAIYIEMGAGVYHISDLSIMKWSRTLADTDKLKKTIADACDYMALLDSEMYYHVSWDRAIAAIGAGVEVSTKYSATKQEIDEADENIHTAVNKLIPITNRIDYVDRYNELCEICAAIPEQEVTAESYQKLYEVIAKGEDLRIFDYAGYQAVSDEIVKAMSELVRADGEAWVVPVIKNIEDGAVIDVSQEVFVPEWEGGTATLDNYIIDEGAEVFTDGEHILSVYNGGAAVTVKFTVTGELSVPSIEGAEHGKSYTEVTLSWDYGIGILNGEQIESGTVLDTNGVYALTVTSREKSSAILFWIEGALSKLLGDIDGDYIISVADALAVLRVAAQLNEATDRMLKVGDMDSDGSISVADALYVLRIAASLK